jgi:putative FmdB family regulatory protein
MPIYEYLCTDCGETFEKMVRFSEAGLAPACPKCTSKETHKKLSTIASFGVSSSGSTSSSGSSCGSRGGFS